MFRSIALVIFVVCIAISARYRRRARLESGTIPRSQEGGLVLAARAAGGLAALSAILLHILAPGAMRWASFVAPDAVSWFGVLAGALAIPAVYWVFSSLGRNVSETVLTKDRHELVTIGPYRWVRHPLYATGVLLLTALGLMVKSWLILLFAAVALVTFRFVVIPAEEQRLIAKFGEAYRRYMLHTGRLFPRVRAAASNDI